LLGLVPLQPAARLAAQGARVVRVVAP
jgi:hypothetical protein